MGTAGVVRVVADSHALIWYVFGDENGRLTPTASEALAAADAGEGIAVSIASVIDLWYVTQTTGAVRTDQLAAIVDLLNDAESSLDPIPISANVVAAFGSIPLPALRDPWDRLIMATAIDLGVPLVSADARIAATGLIEVLW